MSCVSIAHDLTLCYSLIMRMSDAVRLQYAALAALYRARWQIARHPFPELADALGRHEPACPAAPPLTPEQQAAARAICNAVTRWGRLHGPLFRCLVRCLAAARLLQQAGIPYLVCCGAQPASANRLAAHAWLQAGTAAVGQNPDDRFAIVARFVFFPSSAQQRCLNHLPVS